MPAFRSDRYNPGVIARNRKTVDDYMRLPDETRVELIQGEYCVSPSPSFIHQQTVVRVTLLLRLHVKSRQLGEVVCAPFDCILSNEDVVQPDVLFVATANLGRIRERLHGAPDLVVEVISRTHEERDRIVKRDLYLKHGVPEFWIVDPAERIVEVRTLGAGAWETLGTFSVGDSFSSRILPELRVAVRDVFEG